MTSATASVAYHFTPLLAQAGGPSPGIAWGLILLLVALGLILTLTPAKRTAEVKKPTDDQD